MGDEEEEVAESGGNGWDVSPTINIAGARIATACS